MIFIELGKWNRFFIISLSSAVQYIYIPRLLFTFNEFQILSLYFYHNSHPTHLSRRYHPGMLFSLDPSNLVAHPGPWTGTNIREERSIKQLIALPFLPTSFPYSDRTGQHGRAHSPSGLYGLPVDTEPSVPTFCLVCLTPASADRQRCRR